MPASPSDPEDTLADHLRTLYPLARVLAPSDDAPSLIRHVYEEAINVPPVDRPEDRRAWLLRLLLNAQDEPLHTGGAEVQAEQETSFTNDPFRREVADRTAKRMLPAAFAACSLHERFILAVDVLGCPTDEELATALGTSATNARSIRDRARSTLRASLRDVLNGPERMLVDVALPDDALRDHLDELLCERYQPVPDSVQDSVTAILSTARENQKSSSSTDTSSAGMLRSAYAHLRQRASVRSLFALVLLLVVVAAGIGGASYLLSSSPESSPTLVEMTAEYASEVSVTHATTDPDAAQAYIQQTWNRRLSVPDIEETRLDGIGRLEISNTVEVPVLVYSTADGSHRLVAYAFNYAVLDQLATDVTMEHDLRTRLAANQSLVEQEHAEHAVVLWRHRDDIFVLVAPSSEGASLASRIQP